MALIRRTAEGAGAIRYLCKKIPVACIGERADGVSAFDMGARYFMEAPVTAEKIAKALSRCLGWKLEQVI